MLMEFDDYIWDGRGAKGRGTNCRPRFIDKFFIALSVLIDFSIAQICQIIARKKMPEIIFDTYLYILFCFIWRRKKPKAKYTAS
jgi:hypothetical protein